MCSSRTEAEHPPPSADGLWMCRQRAAASPQSSNKRVSRTPIIVIPAAPSSIISMYNVKELLKDLR